MASSTSMDETFSPPVMITSFLRSRMLTCPSSSMIPPSPVWNQPPSRAASVSSGCCQYPAITVLLRTSSSPSASTRTSVPTAGVPARISLRARSDEGRSSHSERCRLTVSRGEVSVRP